VMNAMGRVHILVAAASTGAPWFGR
jgi:hypothetical protein